MTATATDLTALPDDAAARETVQLVALDIDGTLISHDGFLSVEAREAVDRLRDAGVHVVLATGRSLSGAEPILSELGIERGWAVCSNGAVTVRLDPGLESGYEVVEAIVFDAETALRAIRAELPDAHIAIEKIGSGSYVTSPFPEGELNGDQWVTDFEVMCKIPATRVVVRSTAHTAENFTDMMHRLGLEEVSYFVGWTAWVDIVSPGVTKATALQRLCDDLGVNRELTVAVGDGMNDVAMLEWAGQGVAMGHASAPVIAAADQITLPISDDGVVPVLLSLLDD